MAKENRMKGELILIEAIRLQCHRCKVWYIYKGYSRERSLCPKCGTTNLFDVFKDKVKDKDKKESDDK